MAKQLSIGEAAKHVGVSRDTLRRWEKKGKITPLRSPSNRRYYTTEQLDEMLKKPKSEPRVSQPKTSSTSATPLKLVFYSLLALVAAVILVLVIQIFVF